MNGKSELKVYDLNIGKIIQEEVMIKLIHISNIFNFIQLNT